MSLKYQLHTRFDAQRDMVFSSRDCAVLAGRVPKPEAIATAVPRSVSGQRWEFLSGAGRGGALPGHEVLKILQESGFLYLL